MTIPQEIRDWLISERRFPVLATIAPNGMPSQSTMWFDLDADRDDTLVLNTRIGRRKDRHLRRDPRASLCFSDGYEYVTFEGSVELDDDRDQSLTDIKRIAQRYGSNPVQFDGQERVTIRLRVERIHRHNDVARKRETRGS